MSEEKVNNWVSIGLFLAWNIGILIFPIVIYTLGGSLFWFLLAIPFLMSSVPEVIYEEELGTDNDK